jgi:hypothetical protein
MSSKKVAVKEVQKEKSLEIAKGLDKTSVINQFAQTKLVVIDALDSLTNKLVQGMDILNEVETAIKDKKEALKEAAQIEVEADTLSKLIASQEETRKAWGREEADYKYNLEKNRNIELDQWTLHTEKENREFEKALDAKTEAHNAKVLAFRTQEQELLDLRTKVTAFPAQLAEAVTAKEKEVTKSLGSEYHFKSTIQQKDTASELALLKQANQTQKERILELEKALEEARNLQKDAVSRVQSIAEKAIEGASKHQTVVMPSSESGNNSKK